MSIISNFPLFADNTESAINYPQYKITSGKDTEVTETVRQIYEMMPNGSNKKVAFIISPGTPTFFTGFYHLDIYKQNGYYGFIYMKCHNKTVDSYSLLYPTVWTMCLKNNVWQGWKNATPGTVQYNPIFVNSDEEANTVLENYIATMEDSTSSIFYIQTQNNPTGELQSGGWYMLVNKGNINYAWVIGIRYDQSSLLIKCKVQSNKVWYSWQQIYPSTLDRPRSYTASSLNELNSCVETVYRQMNGGTSHHISISNIVAFSPFNGGVYRIDLFKASDTYGYIIATSYMLGDQNGIRRFIRNVKNGIWSDWISDHVIS